MQLASGLRILGSGRYQHHDQQQCRSMVMRSAAGQLLRHVQLRCSSARNLTTSAVGYQQAQQQGGQQTGLAWTPPPFPAIQTINLADAQAVTNRVQLTGTLGTDLERVETDQGVVGKMVLYVRPNQKTPDVSDKYTLELYGEMAARASGNLRKGMRVNVEGRMWCENYADKSGTGRVKMVVEADQIVVCKPRAEEAGTGAEADSYAAPAPPPSPPPQQQQQQQRQPAVQASAPSLPPQAAPAAAPAAAGGAADKKQREQELWVELQQNPRNFWDNRAKKTNPKAPDYKHKQTGEALWLSSMSAPQWTESLRTPQ